MGKRALEGFDALEAWCIKRGARMLVGGPLGPRPCWEHRAVGGLLLRAGLLLLRVRMALGVARLR